MLRPNFLRGRLPFLGAAASRRDAWNVKYAQLAGDSVRPFSNSKVLSQSVYDEDGLPVFDVSVDPSRSRVYVWGDNTNGKLRYYSEEQRGLPRSRSQYWTACRSPALAAAQNTALR